MEPESLTIYEPTARCAHCHGTFRARFMSPDCWLCWDCVVRVDRMTPEEFVLVVARTHPDLAVGADLVEVARRVALMNGLD